MPFLFAVAKTKQFSSLKYTLDTSVFCTLEYNSLDSINALVFRAAIFTFLDFIYQNAYTIVFY